MRMKIVPRVYRIIQSDNYLAWLRIDYSYAEERFVGRYKTHARDLLGSHGEEPEYDLQVNH
jgi:hypothetical protein